MVSRRHGCSRLSLLSSSQEQTTADAIELLRVAANTEDDDGNPSGSPEGVDQPHQIVGALSHLLM